MQLWHDGYNPDCILGPRKLLVPAWEGCKCVVKHVCASLERRHAGTQSCDSPWRQHPASMWRSTEAGGEWRGGSREHFGMGEGGGECWGVGYADLLQRQGWDPADMLDPNPIPQVVYKLLGFVALEVAQIWADTVGLLYHCQGKGKSSPVPHSNSAAPQIYPVLDPVLIRTAL